MLALVMKYVTGQAYEAGKNHLIAASIIPLMMTSAGGAGRFG